MALLIREMKMPPSCVKCPMCDEYTRCSVRNIIFDPDDDWQFDMRPGWCPITEVTTCDECEKNTGNYYQPECVLLRSTDNGGIRVCPGADKIEGDRDAQTK